jgi:uncharacterized membrane protein YhaH (DUF805 family)
MFKNPFSFDGRIRRTEYGVSCIIYFVVAVFLNLIIASSKDASVFGLLYIFMLWFLWAQGAKRCHDVGHNGWWQIIPFYSLWLLFQDGEIGSNEYGANPKEIRITNGQVFMNDATSQTPGGTYPGGYSGGHNSSNTTASSLENQIKSDGFKDGDLYK